MRRNVRTIIESIGISLPPHAVTTGEVLAGCHFQLPIPLQRLTGIESRRVAEGQYSIDLAVEAAERCLKHSRHGVDDIELVIVCSISRMDRPGNFTFEPSSAVQLKHLLGLSRAIAFDITNACPGFFTALQIGDAFVASGALNCALVVTGEYITHLMRTAQREINKFTDPRMACLTLGDAGAAVILERSPEEPAGFEKISLCTLGRYSSYCVAKPSDRLTGGAVMLTDNLRISAATIEHGIQHSTRILREAAWDIQNVDHIIAHQTSAMTLEAAAQQLNAVLGKEICNRDNMVNNLAERGNTATSTHFVALYDHILKGKVQNGDRIVFSITGSGLTIGTALYTLDDLPDRLRRARPDGGSYSYKPLRGPTAPVAIRPGRVRVVGSGIATEEADGSQTRDLLVTAARRSLEDWGGAWSGIDLVIHCGVYRTDLIVEPAMAAFLADDLGLGGNTVHEHSVLAFDIINSGVGFLDGCHVAAKMISSGKAARALVVAAEVDNSIGAADVQPLGIRQMGSAVVLELEQLGEHGFGTFAFKYDTTRIDMLSAHSVQKNGVAWIVRRRDEALNRIYLEAFPEVVHFAMESEKVSTAEVKAVIAPSLYPGFPSAVAGALGLSNVVVQPVKGDRGDTFTSTWPLGYAAVCRSGADTDGGIALLLAAGAGLEVACATYRL